MDKEQPDAKEAWDGPYQDQGGPERPIDVSTLERPDDHNPNLRRATQFLFGLGVEANNGLVTPIGDLPTIAEKLAELWPGTAPADWSTRMQYEAWGRDEQDGPEAWWAEAAWTSVHPAFPAWLADAKWNAQERVQ